MCLLCLLTACFVYTAYICVLKAAAPREQVFHENIEHFLELDSFNMQSRYQLDLINAECFTQHTTYSTVDLIDANFTKCLGAAAAAAAGKWQYFHSKYCAML